MRSLTRIHPLAAICVLFAIVSLLFLLQYGQPILIEYHKWRLRSAMLAEFAASNGNPPTTARIWRVLGVDALDPSNRYRAHERGLIRLGYLQKKEIPFTTYPDAEVKLGLSEKARSQFPNSLWEYYPTDREWSTLIVTAPASDMDRWHELVPGDCRTND